MNFINSRKPILYLYTPFVIWAILIVLLNNLVSPFQIALTFFGLIFIPGFALSRLLKIYIDNNLLGQIILWLTLGLIFNLLLGFLAIEVGSTISVLIWAYIIFSIIFFVLAFIFDCLRPNLPQISISLNIKRIFKIE